MNRFVILFHKLSDDVNDVCDGDHWDVMLESERVVNGVGKLLTWSIPPQPISCELKESIDQTKDQTKDHANNQTNEIDSKNRSAVFLQSFSCSARRLPDHRLAYLDYEGTISGNRGRVTRIDCGTYKKIGTDKFILSGKLIHGELTFSKYSETARCRNAIKCRKTEKDEPIAERDDSRDSSNDSIDSDTCLLSFVALSFAELFGCCESC